MKSFKATVDRIEGQMAVLLVGEESRNITLPLDCLPKDTSEGTVLDFSVEIDVTATSEAKSQVQDLIDRLSRGES